MSATNSRIILVRSVTSSYDDEKDHSQEIDSESLNNNSNMKKTSIISETSSSFTTISNAFCYGNIPKEVPGRLGFSWLNIIGVLRKGHHFYSNKMRENKSYVFKVNIFGTRILLCNFESMNYLFDKELVWKEPRFGTMNFNLNALNNYCPMMFQNRDNHSTTKGVVLDYINIVHKNFCPKAISDLVAKQLHDLSNQIASKSNVNFEEEISKCVCSITTNALLKLELHYGKIRFWLQQSLVKPFREVKESAEIEEVVEYLRTNIATSPFVEDLHKKHSDICLEETVLEVLMLSIFNAYGALSPLLVSCVIYLTKLTKTDRCILKEEAAKFFEELTISRLSQLKNIENFITEVIRLHPPAFAIFGRASKDFILETSQAAYKISEGDLLCGNLYLAQRDSRIFQNPYKFDFHRFEQDKSLKNFITAFGGNFTTEVDVHSHQCVGKDLSFMILQLFICHMISYDIEASSNTNWSGKNIKRFSGSDKPLTVKTFAKKKTKPLT